LIDLTLDEDDDNMIDLSTNEAAAIMTPLLLYQAAVIDLTLDKCRETRLSGKLLEAFFEVQLRRTSRLEQENVMKC
jgi:hypothetical protein